MTRMRMIPIFTLIPLVLLGSSLPPSWASERDQAATSQALAEADSWPMAAANPQRTSHNSVEVPGDLGAVWYRPIDPYIDNKVQVIAADNKVFLSTSKGLYAFDANTGNQLWGYGTELPLGNSPTYYNGTLYVGGFDHKIHAVQASNGQLKAGWSFVNAEAGFDTNPLVVNDTFTGNQPMVLAGSRDGFFYALDGNNGTLKWKYQTGGPIHFSAAYKEGKVYFASNDSYAYALNIGNGSLTWKSEKFPGVGFDSYWPVIYTDTYPSSPTYGRDFVILAGSLKAGRWIDGGPYGCQIHTPNFEMYDGKPGCTDSGAQAYLWTSGTPTMKCDSIYDYFNNNAAKWGSEKPWWRVVFILDRNNGVEQTPYAPFNVAGLDGDGQGYKQPPVVGGDGVLYQRVGYGNGGNGGCSGWIVGWKFGTPYISEVSTESAACDEPAAFTSGGDLIYYGEGSFNHEGFGTFDTAQPLRGDWKWTGSVSSLNGSRAKYTSLDLSGKFGSSSGAYAYMDGFLNYSPIPYAGKLYVINGNVLYALSAEGSASSPLATVQAPGSQTPAAITTTQSQVQQRLYDEVQKMLAAGHLRPGFHSSGLTSQWMMGAYNYPIPGDNLVQYFHNPSDTVVTLIGVLEHIDQHPENANLQSLRTPIRNYIQSNYGPGAPYSFVEYASVGWRNGAQREVYDDLPEMTGQLQEDYDANYYMASNPRPYIWNYNNLRIATPLGYGQDGGFPPDSFYGAWKYAQTFPGTAASIFNAMKSKLSIPGSGNDMTDANLIKYPYILNQYIIGYRGYVELDKLANNLTDITMSSKYAEYSRLLNLRWSTYSKDPNWTAAELEFSGTISAASNFMYMTPELAELMRTNVLAKVQATVDQYQILTPNWFVSKFSHSGPESYAQILYDYPALFQARAYVLGQPFEELIKYLDVPAFERGDLFYIQNLVAILQAPSDGRIPIFADVPFSHPYSTQIEALYRAGYIAGCSTNPLLYCPENTMNRAESSVFVERGIHAASYDPPTSSTQVFADIPLDSWAAKWVNGLWQDQYTAGCGTNPLVYCPWQGHTRAEGSVFYLRMLHGATFEPPQPTQQTFVDVPLDAWYARWAKAAVDAGLIEACQISPELRFCPNDPLTRALAADMMVRAKGLNLP